MRTRSSFFASLKLSRFFDGRLAKPRAGAATTTDAAPTRDGRAGSRRDGGAQSGGSGAAQAARLRAQLRRQQAVLPLIIVGEGRRSATRAAVVYRAVSMDSSRSTDGESWVYAGAILKSISNRGRCWLPPRADLRCSTIVEGPVRPLQRAVLTRFSRRPHIGWRLQAPPLAQAHRRGRGARRKACTQAAKLTAVER